MHGQEWEKDGRRDGASFLKQMGFIREAVKGT
jgi:hypothetical protein